MTIHWLCDVVWWGNEVGWRAAIKACVSGILTCELWYRDIALIAQQRYQGTYQEGDLGITDSGMIRDSGSTIPPVIFRTQTQNVTVTYLSYFPPDVFQKWLSKGHWNHRDKASGEEAVVSADRDTKCVPTTGHPSPPLRPSISRLLTCSQTETLYPLDSSSPPALLLALLTHRFFLLPRTFPPWSH